MFVQTDDAAVALIDRIMGSSNEFLKAALKSFASFGDEDWATLEIIVKKFINGLSIQEVNEYVKNETNIEVSTSDEPKESTKKRPANKRQPLKNRYHVVRPPLIYRYWTYLYIRAKTASSEIAWTILTIAVRYEL